MIRQPFENVLFTILEGGMLPLVVLTRSRFGYAFLTSNWMAWLLYLTNTGFLVLKGGDMLRNHPEWFVASVAWLVMPLYHFVSRWQWVQRILGQEIWDFSEEVPPDYAGRSWWFAPVFALIVFVYNPIANRIRFLPQTIQMPDWLIQVFIEPITFFSLGVALERF